LSGLEHLFGKESSDAHQFNTMLSNHKMLSDQDRNFIMASTEMEKHDKGDHR